MKQFTPIVLALILTTLVASSAFAGHIAGGRTAGNIAGGRTAGNIAGGRAAGHIAGGRTATIPRPSTNEGLINSTLRLDFASLIRMLLESGALL